MLGTNDSHVVTVAINKAVSCRSTIVGVARSSIIVVARALFITLSEYLLLVQS